MIDIRLIRTNSRVVGSNDAEFAVVAGADGPNSIKLERDSGGRHHYIPLGWVTMVDHRVHLDRPSDQAMREWTTISASN